jgi:light-regulated signal transduction histidine kinase (bacteriophytochrome)
LDEQANEFLQFTVDGSLRMQRLINDLLAYSQVGRPDVAPVRMTSLEKLLPNTLSDLQVALDESSAVVTHDPLPSILANTPQIAQLLQNLIGNAIKYRGTEPPKVHVGVVREGNQWKFSVQDNGQGFRPDQAERIFSVFKRLHGREIPGTGIGLAICKRVVERHGGRIWATSNPGAGATFYFTLPVAEPETGAPAGSE